MTTPQRRKQLTLTNLQRSDCKRQCRPTRVHNHRSPARQILKLLPQQHQHWLMPIIRRSPGKLLVSTLNHIQVSSKTEGTNINTSNYLKHIVILLLRHHLSCRVRIIKPSMSWVKMRSCRSIYASSTSRLPMTTLTSSISSLRQEVEQVIPINRLPWISKWGKEMPMGITNNLFPKHATASQSSQTRHLSISKVQTTYHPTIPWLKKLVLSLISTMLTMPMTLKPLERESLYSHMIRTVGQDPRIAKATTTCLKPQISILSTQS